MWSTQPDRMHVSCDGSFHGIDLAAELFYHVGFVMFGFPSETVWISGIAPWRPVVIMRRPSGFFPNPSDIMPFLPCGGSRLKEDEPSQSCHDPHGPMVR